MSQGKFKKKNDNKSMKQNDDLKSKAAKKSRKTGGKSLFTMDIFNDELIENAYYTCHNIMDVLKCRGFPWPQNQKKKKKGRR